MTLALILASIINGPSEEIYWRGCLDEAGKNAGISKKIRLIYAPLIFSLWHTAFVYHLVPHDGNWFGFWGMIVVTTWISGVIWMWVLQKTKRLIPQCFYHALANFFSVFPMILITVLKLQF